MAQAKPLAPVVVVAVAAILIWALLPVSNVGANGSHGDSIQAFYGAVGDYVVRVDAIPIVGDLHLVVYVTEKDDTSEGTPVQGANVEATATGPGDEPLQLGPAFNTPQTESDPSLYSVTLPGALEEGTWDVTLRVEPQGLEVSFDIDLQEPRQFNELIIAVLAAFVLFLAWMLVSWRRQAARRRRGG